MKLHELIDKELLAEMYDKGYINLQVHPREPLGILNYAKKTAWEGMWNDATMKCRGLIYDMTTMEVLARPFEKFFNYEQLGPEWVRPFGRVEVTDKLDGSLGILYPLPDGSWAVATRGSFASDQALHATERLREYEYSMDIDGVTYLFEIIYPENRIVLDYGDMDELVLLGGVVINSGLTFGPREAKFMLDWNGPVANVFEARTWEDAMALPPRENAEGIVVTFQDGTKVKLKQDDYVALHRIVTGLTNRTVWEAMSEGRSIEQIQEPLPEEFHPWVEEVATDLLKQAFEIQSKVWYAYDQVCGALPEGFTRKDFALAVKDHPLRAHLFRYLDGQSIWDIVWKQIKPPAVRTMVDTQEDD